MKRGLSKSELRKVTLPRAVSLTNSIRDKFEAVKITVRSEVTSCCLVEFRRRPEVTSNLQM